ncbi:MAG: CBS domain-containing protein [Bacteroidota bacterium]
MSTEHLISLSIPTLTPEDTGTHALDLMDEHKITELPVVSNDAYLALIKESDLMDWNTPGNALSTAPFLNYKPAIPASAHPFEVVRIMSQLELNVLPVVGDEQKYLGCVTKDTLLKHTAEYTGINNPGGIIVLEVAPRNYTLYEIARICENEDVSIVNVQVYTTEDGMLEVTLKLNRTGLSAVVSSFERHSYVVQAVYGEEQNREDITNKYNLLMNYINM